ncbi:YIEGIA family protein [Oceanobacillus alkalisoli]|uniref:YIEGIA family protein n=1 Tax=Oceanobacillus alkalisoli TaxID=2925113 RepID=UPI001EF0D42F|nr:YIEGIA family protein [Oceanobacillus alkalisoli]MCF3941654.1 YIEGIA family protein [Oceanobacillus alkalisoli]MCG5102936.1 YIEGIA family protein [Oceanobacillus alkalisoli]
MNEYTYAILFGVIVGTLARILMLKTDYRQYPTYLHGKIIHASLGFIAASLGAIAVPALIEKEYTAVTLLTVAATQFRDVRNMERNTLAEIDPLELVPRGRAYIEGIAISFESRNYLCIFSAFISTILFIYFDLSIALAGGIGSILLSLRLMSGSTIKDIADIEYTPLKFDGAGLYVDNIYIMNIGIKERQEEILKYGAGFIIHPKNRNVVQTLANLGQRQAMLHDVSVSLGIFRDSGTPALTPLIKRDLDDGRIGMFILPQNRDIDLAIKIIGAVPVLESAIRMPTESKSYHETRDE